MKTRNILVAVGVAGLVIWYVRRKASSAPPAQSAGLSALGGLTGAIKAGLDGIVSPMTPPGVGVGDTGPSIPHGSTASELESANGWWASGQNPAPTKPANYNELAISGTTPFDVASLYS